jgi:hypothetical protein
MLEVKSLVGSSEVVALCRKLLQQSYSLLHQFGLAYVAGIGYAQWHHHVD